MWHSEKNSDDPSHLFIEIVGLILSKSRLYFKCIQLTIMYDREKCVKDVNMFRLDSYKVTKLNKHYRLLFLTHF